MPTTTVPRIALPADNPTRLAQLRAKLVEYQGRVLPSQAPEAQMGSLCKVLVLHRLLQDGHLDPAGLCCELAARFESSFNPRAFDNACRVIADYCVTGGAHNHGGTGLPEVRQEEPPVA